jgi:hypothetical protein
MPKVMGIIVDIPYSRLSIVFSGHSEGFSWQLQAMTRIALAP